MVSVTELVIYSIFNYAPYALLALYAFRTSWRFGKKATLLLYLVSIPVQVLIFLAGSYLPDPYPIIFTYIGTILDLVLYFLAVKARFGRTLFNLFMVKNVANCTVVIAKGIEGQLFPASAEILYSWTNTLCLVLVLLVLFPPLVLFIRHFFSKDIRDSIGPKMWSFLWLIPFFFLVMWTDRFYYSGIGSLNLALQPKMILIMSLYIAGQLGIYACIAQMVIRTQQTLVLLEENRQLSQQAQQYKDISARVREVTTLRHDMRHSLVLMQQYCEEKRYDKLEEYLNQYTARFPRSSIRYIGNPILNMLLVYYHGMCQKLNIYYSVDLGIPDELPLTDVEITVLFGNLLENAVDACKERKDQTGIITAQGRVHQGQLIFRLSNTYTIPIRRDHFGDFISSKHEGNGIGIESARTIVEKCGGSIRFEYTEEVFHANIILPMA